MICHTSDTHFQHKNICGPKVSSWTSGYRNFSSLEEMEELLITRCNEKVRREDTLIHGGDVCMGQAALHWPRIRQRINCQNIILVLGNHDDKLQKHPNILKDTFSKVVQRYSYYYRGTLVVCDHYPLSVWDEMGKGAIMLHGHTHGNFIAEGKSMDVGVDTNDYYPYTIDEIFDIMAKKSVVIKDHHTERTSY